MIFRRPIFTIFMAAIIYIAWNTQVAVAANDPILQLESESKIELDLKMMIDDLLPLALEAAAAESEDQAVWIQMLVDLINVRALDRLYLESELTKQEGRTKVSISLQPEVTDGLLPALFSISPGEYRFGSYLPEEEVTMVVSLPNFAGLLGVLLDLLATPQYRDLIPFLTVDDDGELDVFGVKPRQDLLPLLSGELDLVMFTPEEGYDEEMPPFTLAIGANEGSTLRERILEILGQFAGPEMAAELAAMPGEPVGDFMFFSLPEGLSYAVSPDYLVVTSETEKMATLLVEPDRDFKPVRALEYGRLNGDHLLMMFAAEAVAEGESGSPEDKMKAELLAALGEEPVGMLEYWVTSDQAGTIDMEIVHPGALMSMQYQMLKTMLTLAPQARALEKEREMYREILHSVDAAFTAYGEDHGGIFPEQPQVLVEAGYLDYFPELEPTPLGEYLEGGYTYVPLRDETNAIVGYYFFIYGVEPKSGQDVFTADNLADPENFQVGRDGKPDGVVNFCYDGIALDQVEAWQYHD